MAVVRAADRLFEEGVVDGLGAVDLGRRGGGELVEAVEEALGAGRFALVLGGGFSSLVGALPALRPRGGLGLLLVGPQPDLARVLEDPGSERAVAGGLPDAIGIVAAERVGALGADAATREGLAVLGHAGGRLHGFWVLLDVAVLDEAVMRAVPAPSPEGIAWGELAAILGLAIGSGAAVGLQIAGYAPELDPGGANGRALAGTINTVLAEFSWAKMPAARR